MKENQRSDKPLTIAMQTIKRGCLTVSLKI